MNSKIVYVPRQAEIQSRMRQKGFRWIRNEYNQGLLCGFDNPAKAYALEYIRAIRELENLKG